MTTQTPQSPRTSGTDLDPTQTVPEGGASVRERATQVGGTAKDEAAGVAQEVKYQARDLVGEARGQVRQQVDVQKGRLSDLLRDIGEELDQMAERSDRNGIASDLARQAAGRTRDVLGYLDGGDDLVSDVRSFARRRPGTFLLGALAAGVIAGRATRAAAAAKRQQSSAATESGPEARVGGDTTAYSGTAYPGAYAGGSAGYAGQYGSQGTAQGYASPGYGSQEYGSQGYGTATDATTTAHRDQSAVYPGTPSTAPTSGYSAAPEATTTGYGSGYPTQLPDESATDTPIAATTYADPDTTPESLPLRGETERAEGFAPPNGGERQ